MRGGKSLADRGVIPRLLSAIYRRCKKIEKDSAGATHVEVALEYFEIYCDRVYDLFEPPEKRTPSGLPIRDNHGKTVVVGLTEKPCTTLKEFEQLYDQANMNRSTSATKVSSVAIVTRLATDRRSSTLTRRARMPCSASRLPRPPRPPSTSVARPASILPAPKTTVAPRTTRSASSKVPPSTSPCSYWRSASKP
jgi:hypothetical protein